MIFGGVERFGHRAERCKGRGSVRVGGGEGGGGDLFTKKLRTGGLPTREVVEVDRAHPPKFGYPPPVAPTHFLAASPPFDSHVNNNNFLFRCVFASVLSVFYWRLPFPSQSSQSLASSPPFHCPSFLHTNSCRLPQTPPHRLSSHPCAVSFPQRLSFFTSLLIDCLGSSLASPT